MFTSCSGLQSPLVKLGGLCCTFDSNEAASGERQRDRLLQQENKGCDSPSEWNAQSRHLQQTINPRMFVKEGVLKRWRLDSEMSQSGSSSSPRHTPPPISPPSYFSRLLSGGLFMAAVCARSRCRSSWRRECVKFVYSDSVSLPAFCSPSPVSTQIANRLSKSRLKRERNFYVLSGEKRRGWEDRREEQKAAPRGASPPLLCITVAGMCERTWAKPRWNQPVRARVRHARVWLKLKQSSLGTSCTITPLIKRLLRPWWSFDLELLGLLLLLLTSCLPFSPFVVIFLAVMWLMF